jgi:hypothetical protein
MNRVTEVGRFLKTLLARSNRTDCQRQQDQRQVFTEATGRRILANLFGSGDTGGPRGRSEDAGSYDIDIQAFIDQRDPRIEALATVINEQRPSGHAPFEFYPAEELRAWAQLREREKLFREPLRAERGSAEASERHLLSSLDRALRRAGRLVSDQTTETWSRLVSRQYVGQKAA